MMKHKTSVLIVNSKDKNTKVLQVPTHIIVNWRKYAYYFFFITLTFFLVSGYLVFQNTSRAYKDRLARANYIQSQIDLKKALTTFASIDSGIFRINSFLQERGLEHLKVENVGGVAEGFDIIHINELTDFYDNQLFEMEETLFGLPLGKPFEGEINSIYGYRRNPFTSKGIEFHSGVDFKGRQGDSIRATGNGVVSFAGYNGGYGRCIVINHNESLQTLYAHLKQIDVKEGQTIQSGDHIGLMGSTGRSTGPHLHYEVIFDDKKINPLKYISFDLE
ncbi:MAG: M23 family metallopeptidase [Proteiniphilum sp.]|jgi:murein DD-endopeptidase MepM/ murein hydrolase activator NlpD|nr:M23 family metallopeptidase [Proteiniphilum sp.]MDD3778721.1 M23 family metallopeptidase [Proteiniphilum sp.]NCB24016.1 M23 family metallopeptidase [Bacteroidia bacterium]